jgi:hypothetical protein
MEDDGLGSNSPYCRVAVLSGGVLFAENLLNLRKDTSIGLDKDLSSLRKAAFIELVDSTGQSYQLPISSGGKTDHS